MDEKTVSEDVTSQGALVAEVALHPSCQTVVDGEGALMTSGSSPGPRIRLALLKEMEAALWGKEKPSPGPRPAAAGQCSA